MWFNLILVATALLNSAPNSFLDLSRVVLTHNVVLGRSSATLPIYRVGWTVLTALQAF